MYGVWSNYSHFIAEDDEKLEITEVEIGVGTEASLIRASGL